MGIVPQLINVVRFVLGSWYTACALAKVSQIGNYIYTHILVSFLFFFSDEFPISSWAHLDPTDRVERK